MRFLAALLSLLALLPLPAARAASGAGPQPAELAVLLEPLRAEAGLPALAALVIHADGRVEIAATGKRRLDADTPVTAGDKWHIGSNTKAMTAALAARLVEKGAIGWDTTLAAAFPDLADAMRPDWRGVTLAQLLGMVGGAGADIGALAAWRAFWAGGKPLPDLRLDLVREVTAAPPAAPPGSKFIYSNASYVMAGAMLERATGRPWEDLLRAELFEPLGMEGAGFGAPTGDQPWGHRAMPLIGGLLGPSAVDPAGGRADNPAALGPAGTVHLTLADYAKWLRAVLDGAAGKGGFLTPDSWARLLAPGLDNYALGWGAVATPWAGDRPALLHAGSNTMWFFNARLAPARGFAVAIATNTAGPATEKAIARATDRLLERAGAH